MKSHTLILGAVVAVIVFFGTDTVDGQVPERSCKAVVGDLTKRQLGGIGICTKSMKFKNGKDKSKKMNCILKCVLKREKVLLDDDTFTLEQKDAVVAREFPLSMIDKANTTFSTCGDLIYGKLDPNPETDEFCKTYDPFIKCLLNGLGSICSS